MTFSLFFAAIGVAAAVTGDRSHFLGAIGFTCWAVVWGRNPPFGERARNRALMSGPLISC